MIPSLCLILPWVKFSNPPDCQEVLAGVIISTDLTLEQTNFHKVQQPRLCSLQPQAAEMNPWGCGEPATVSKGSRQSSLCSSKARRKGTRWMQSHLSAHLLSCPSAIPCHTAQAASKHLSARALSYCFPVSIYQR